MSSHSLSFQHQQEPTRNAHKKGQLNLPQHRMHHHHGHYTGKNGLALPSQTIVDLRGLYHALFSYLAHSGDPPTLSTSPSLSRLKVLTEQQLLELIQDLCDEVDRRAPELQNHPALEPCLEVRPDFTDSRNHNRQKLATLKSDWFRSLACDVWTEARRRHPPFSHDEGSILQQAHAHGESEEEVDEADDVLDDDDVATTFTQRKETHHTTPAPKVKPNSSFNDSAYASDDGHSHEEAIMVHQTHATELKPSWLLNAEEIVKRHIGPNRSSHDWSHADRMRRSAVALGKKAARRHSHVDLKVIELASLFAVAVNDTKHCVKDPKDFIDPWAKDNEGALSKQQLNLVVKIVRTVGLKREERRKKEQRETDWHKQCIELHVVCDADKLEMLGFIGILRTSASYGAMHKPLYDSADQSNASHAIKAETAVAHFLEKARLITLMHTPEGRAAAQTRYNRMKEFAEAVGSEFELEGLQ